MTNERKKLGQRGEKAAIVSLQTKGFIILETGYRTQAAEIDIIAKDGECICFIEVKTRSSYKKGLPKESVTLAKQRKIITGAQFYLKEKILFNSKIRFDVIEVLENRGCCTINLIKHAFLAS